MREDDHQDQRTLAGEVVPKRPAYGADERHEAPRLFTPAPEQLPGQLAMGEADQATPDPLSQQQLCAEVPAQKGGRT